VGLSEKIMKVDLSAALEEVKAADFVQANEHMTVRVSLTDN
jgi:hypothetical protein